MHVLIADALPVETGAGLELLGLDVTTDPSLGSHSLGTALQDKDILIVSRTRVTRRSLDAAPRLRLIIQAGGSVDSVDVRAASERGILVADCPGADAAARAELVIGMALALDRDLTRPFGEGRPELAAGLRGRTLGLVGFDATAQRLRAVATGLGMRVMVFSDALTTATASEAEVRRAESLETLFSRCDVVSLHVDGAGDTPLVNAKLLSPRSRLTLINIHRRGLIDLTAAKVGMDAGWLRLGLDVYDADDYGDEVPFSAASAGLLATDRVASRTSEAVDTIAHQVVDQVEAFLQTDRVPHGVNLGERAAPSAVLIVRYHADPAVLTVVFEAIRDGGLTPLQVETGHFIEGDADFVRIALDGPVTPRVIAAIQRHERVIRVDDREV